MVIFSATEHRLISGLPVGIFLLALVLFVHNGCVDSPSNRLKCWTPQEFVPSWVEYTNAFCSSSVQVRRNNGRSIVEIFSAALAMPLFLLLVALLLMVPVAVGQLLNSVLKLTRDPKNERVWLSVLMHLFARALLLVFAIAALCLVTQFPEEKLGFSASREVAALMKGRGNVKFIRSIENTFPCGFSIRQFSRSKSYSVTCTLGQRTPLVLAGLSILAIWVILVFYVTWTVVGFVFHALMIISPTVRRNAAKIVARDVQEDYSEMPVDNKEVAL